MHKITFQTKLLKDGHLYCPKEYASPKAIFKVIVALPDAENEVKSRRPFGLCKGEFVVPDDFDAPLPEFILKEFCYYNRSKFRFWPKLIDGKIRIQ